ncbi:MAG: Holliday junction resolvase-like protein [Thermoproteota archaeon]
MKSEILKFFTLQRQIFGICPHCNDFFRLSDCNIYLKRRPAPDWLDEINREKERLSKLGEKLEEKRKELQRKAQKEGRREAQKVIKRIDPIFTPRGLNPDDAKVIFHPIDYIVFNGMKNGDSIKGILLLDRETRDSTHRSLQRSIEKVIERESYEWQTLRVQEDGKIKIE